MRDGNAADHRKRAEDAEKVSQCLDGDREAFGDLVQKYERPLYALAYSYIGAVEDALDIVQETFLRAYASLRNLSDPCKFGPWTTRIAVRLCLDWIQRSQRQAESRRSAQAHDMELPSAAPDPAQGLQSEEEKERLVAAIRFLPDHYRTAILMRYMQGLSYREIADVLDVPISTVEGRLFKAKKLLRDLLAAVDEEEK